MRKLRIACKVFYLGYKYKGFQFQPKVETVEGKIIEALKECKLINDNSTANFQAASRTDTSVHALGQVFAFNTNERFIIPVINQKLPKDIIIWAKKEVEDDFLPRFKALKRHYKYITKFNDEDLDKMETAAKKFIGYHDFKNFSKRNNEKNTYREIYDFRILQKGKFLIFDVIGNAFLYQMVRRMGKLILEIGRGKYNENDFDDYLIKKIKLTKRIGPAPLENDGALILWDVIYPFEFEIDPYSFEKLKRFINLFYNFHLIRLETMNIFNNFFDE